MLIVNNKKDLASYVQKSPVVLETKKVLRGGCGEEDFEEIEAELVKLLAVADGSPDFGEDWEAWLADNIEEQLQEAIDCIM